MPPYASFNEGFGYPPLEALSHGTPSIIADNTSIPEVCGSAAIACDPFDIDSIAGAIRTVLEFPPSKDEMQSRLAEIGDRQRHDLDRLVELICGRTSAAAGAADGTPVRWAVKAA